MRNVIAFPALVIAFFLAIAFFGPAQAHSQSLPGFLAGAQSAAVRVSPSHPPKTPEEQIAEILAALPTRECATGQVSSVLADRVVLCTTVETPRHGHHRHVILVDPTVYRYRAFTRAEQLVTELGAIRARSGTLTIMDAEFASLRTQATNIVQTLINSTTTTPATAHHGHHGAHRHHDDHSHHGHRHY